MELIANPGTGDALWELRWLVDQAMAWPALVPQSRDGTRCATPADLGGALAPTRQARWGMAKLERLAPFEAVELVVEVPPGAEPAPAPVLCLVGGEAIGRKGACFRGRVDERKDPRTGTAELYGHVELGAAARAQPDLWRLFDIAVFTTEPNFDARASGLPAHTESVDIDYRATYHLGDPDAHCRKGL